MNKKTYNQAMEHKNEFYNNLPFYASVYNDDHEYYLKDVEKAPHAKQDIDFIEKYLYNKENHIHDLVFENKFKKYAKKHGLYLNAYEYNDRAIRKSLEIVRDKHYSNLKPKNTVMGFYRDNEDPYNTCMYCVDAPRCVPSLKKDPQNPTNEIHYNKWHYLCKYTNHQRFNKKTKWYSNKYVCFDCMFVFKRPIIEIRDTDTFKWPCCSLCHKHMICVDVTFAPPPKTDLKKWKELEQKWYDDSKLTYEEFYRGHPPKK